VGATYGLKDVGSTFVRSVPVGAIRVNPYQPRQRADEDLDELTASIREHGVLQPVLVRPVDGGFELVAGERRWRSAQAAGLAVVPAVVREMSDRDAAVVALVENLQRSALDFFDEAEGYRRLVEEFRLTQEELAAQVGRSQPAVANKLRLLRLEPEVRAAISRGMLSERHARAVLRLEGTTERLAAVAAIASAGWSVREAEAWVERRLREHKEVRPTSEVVGDDVAPFLSAVEDVARGLRKAGFAAEVSRREDEEGWTIEVRIARRDAEAGVGRRRA